METLAGSQSCRSLRAIELALRRAHRTILTIREKLSGFLEAADYKQTRRIAQPGNCQAFMRWPITSYDCSATI